MLLIIAGILIIIRLLGLAGVIPAAAQWNGVALVALGLIFAARAFRRGARAEMAAEDAARRQS